MADILFPTDTTGVTPATGDIILIADVSDSNNPKDCTLAELPISTATQTALDAKQATLVSGTNIKTVNGNSLLGSGDLTISGGGSVATDSIWDAKGDLAVGTGANTASRLAVGSNGQVLTADSAEATGMKWATVSGTGDVVGPASSTDNAIARFDSTTGKLLQNSTVTLSDNGDFAAVRTETFGTSNDRSQIAFANPDGSGSSIFSYSGLSGYNSVEIVRNAKYDPTSADWIRFDTGKPVGEFLMDQDGSFEVWTAPAGSNPISNWEQQFDMDINGGATFNVGQNDADFTIKKNTSGNAYVYDAGLDTHTISGAVSTDNKVTVGTTIELGHPSDTTFSRVSAGVAAIEGNNIITADRTASDTQTGVVELATAAETTTGTDATRAVTPDGLAGSEFGKRTVSVLLSGSASGDSALAVGDGLAAVPVDTTLNGMNLVAIKAYVSTVSSSGAPLFQVRRSRRSSATARTTVDMLTTGVSIDANEFESADATTAAVINTSNDDVQTGDILLFDCDTAGTGTKGAQILLTFQLP